MRITSETQALKISVTRHTSYKYGATLTLEGVGANEGRVLYGEYQTIKEAMAWADKHLLEAAVEGHLIGRYRESRSLWYRGLVKWAELDKMTITTAGLNLLYRMEEQ